MATVTYPGVYIDEVNLTGAPIEGVGLSTAAFIGPAQNGDVNTAVKLTSWDAFKQTFGPNPLTGFYLWYAVRGFFEEGGTVCYVVRATNGDYDRVTLRDNAAAQTGAPPAQDTIVVTARDLGKHSPQITVKASQTAAGNLLVSSKKPYNPIGPTVNGVNGNEIVTNDAAKAALFQPGDAIDAGGTTFTVSRVSGASIFTTAPATGATGTIKLADPAQGTTDRLRVDAAVGSKLAPGAVLKLSQTNKTTTYVIVKSVTPQRLSATLTTYLLQLRGPITESYTLAGVALDSVEFKLEVVAGSTKAYDNLSMEPANPRYFADVLEREGAAVVAAPTIPPSQTPAPFNQPDTGGAASNLTGGADDDPTKLTAGHYANAVGVLESVTDAALICVPDSQEMAVQLSVMGHCEKMRDRFGILDSKAGRDLFGANGIGIQRNALDSPRGYVGLFYPWLWVPPEPSQGTRPMLVPPSGHVAGIYARTDQDRGVHKAAAGEEAVLTNVLGVDKLMSDIDQGQLNLDGINVIRVFRPGGRPVLWGARTTAKSTSGGDSNWQYTSTRRLFEYLEKSIMIGIRWAVFEPNNPELWQKLKRTITDFLTRAWRDGALFGDTVEQAFYVRIDEALNPFSERQLGRLHIEIGCQPSFPAEFVVVQIGIWDGGSEVSGI
jgi:phage tail sheath protein FI